MVTVVTVSVAVNGEIHHGSSGHGNSHMVVDNGPVEPEEDNSLIIQYLSNMPPPKVGRVLCDSLIILYLSNIPPPKVGRVSCDSLIIQYLSNMHPPKVGRVFCDSLIIRYL